MELSKDWTPPDPTQRVKDIARALSAYECQVLDVPEAVDNSVRNENYRVLTDRGPLFVRFHRTSRSTDRVRREHRVIQWASAQGLPVVPPLYSATGGTLHEVNGRLVAVFPWVTGSHLQRGRITVAQASVMGAMHGRLHSVLARYPDWDLDWFWDSWGANTEHSSDLLLDLAKQLPNVQLSHDERELIHRTLEAQLGWLQTEGGRIAPDRHSIGVQPVHGDYHERNLLLDNAGGVAAVVDWDMVTRMPRGFELVRCLSFAELLQPPLLDAYLTAYHHHVTLTPSECAAAVELWWQFVARDTWLYRVRLLEADPAVQPFFAEQISRLARFGDPSFRRHLAGELLRLAGPS